MTMGLKAFDLHPLSALYPIVERSSRTFGGKIEKKIAFPNFKSWGWLREGVAGCSGAEKGKIPAVVAVKSEKRS